VPFKPDYLKKDIPRDMLSRPATARPWVQVYICKDIISPVSCQKAVNPQSDA